MRSGSEVFSPNEDAIQRVDQKMSATDEPNIPDYLVKHTVRLSQNLTRVDSLIDLHTFLETIVQNSNERRPEIDDILRSATVLLHASLEDFLRSISIAHHPRTEREHLKYIPLAGIFRNAKFDLGDLVSHRGKTVNDVIESSIHEWLNQQSFNNSTDLANALERIGIDPSQVQYLVSVTQHDDSASAPDCA
jgi:hypothetical protein